MDTNLCNINNTKDDAKLKGMDSLYFSSLSNNQKNKIQNFNLISDNKALILSNGYNNKSDLPKRPSHLKLDLPNLSQNLGLSEFDYPEMGTQNRLPKFPVSDSDIQNSNQRSGISEKGVQNYNLERLNQNPNSQDSDSLKRHQKSRLSEICNQNKSELQRPLLHSSKSELNNPNYKFGLSEKSTKTVSEFDKIGLPQKWGPNTNLNIKSDGTKISQNSDKDFNILRFSEVGSSKTDPIKFVSDNGSPKSETKSDIERNYQNIKLRSEKNNYDAKLGMPINEYSKNNSDYQNLKTGLSETQKLNSEKWSQISNLSPESPTPYQDLTLSKLSLYRGSMVPKNFQKMNYTSPAGQLVGGWPCPRLPSPEGSAVMSVRSLASVGMGSTDGKRMVIRKVPQNTEQLMNIVNSPTPQDEYDFDADSYGAHSDDPDSLYLKPRRQHWANKMQFVLACIGYSVGLGNIWRFPYLCYKSGGGVFLIPYFLIMFFCGIPMLYMELAVGQFTGRGPIGALAQICPLFKGAGLASVVISFLMSTYYSVIIAYGIYYFFTSFKTRMPWNNCHNRWNTVHCWEPNVTALNITRLNNSKTASEEFYDHKVLQISSGIEEPGALRWDLVACLLCAWIMVYFAIWKSIKSSAKVRYFTATLPFLLIVVFLVRSLSLEGADKGMRYFFKPKWELLKSANVWVNAAAQNFNSFGVAFGSMINFASYNKYNNNILHDTLAVSLVNAVTSILVGIFSFAVIGSIANEQRTHIEDVITDGPGLIFVVYPEAIAKMPAAQFWAVLFFFMLLCLGLNSQFAIVEVVVTSIQDGFPGWIKKKLVCHEMLVLIVCVISFLFGLPHVTKGGIYFFQLVDHYAASISIMYLAFFEVIAIAWFYGVWRLSKNIENMNAKTPSLYFKFCWMVAAPLLIMAVWIFCMIDYKTPTYNNGGYIYPSWAIVLGWIISSLSIICIPGFAIYVFCQAEGETWKEKLHHSLLPDLYECRICGDHNCEHMEEEQEMQEISPMLILKLESQNSQSDTKSQLEEKYNGCIDPRL